MLVDNTPSRLVNLVGASLCVHPLGPYIFLPWKDISLFTGGVSTPTSTHTLCRSCVPFLHVSLVMACIRAPTSWLQYNCSALVAPSWHPSYVQLSSSAQENAHLNQHTFYTERMLVDPLFTFPF
jgi:hypothetical protein